jgi:lactate permease
VSLLAAAPIVAILVLMVGLGWSAVRAGLVALAGTLVIAVGAFDFGRGGDAFTTSEGLLGVAAEAAFIAGTVIAIIAPALAIHHLQQRTGATTVLQHALARLTPDPRVAALLIAWFFTLFIEGAAGFGTPIALAAPFLVAAGFQPLAAVAAALFGHAVGVSFGAVGTPVSPITAATDFTGLEIARATVPYHLVLGWILLAAVVLTIGRALPEGGPPWRWGGLAGVTFFVPYFLIGRFLGPELPTLAGALAGAVAFIALVAAVEHRRVRSRPAGDEAGARVEGDEMSVVRACAPYLVLVLLVLVTRLIGPVKRALTGVEISWTWFGEFSGSVQPLYHPGVILPIAFGVGAIAQRANVHDVRAAAAVTNRALGPVVVALLAMVGIARLMSQAGMTDELAAAAATVGSAWPLLAPAVGALGTFITGSATGSNILFTDFQVSTADAVGRPALPLLGAQNFGSAVGNIVCPHNVVAAAATVGLAGNEGAVLRRTLPVAVAYVALGGVLALWLAR